MLDRLKITIKDRYCLPGGEDVRCLADVSASDLIELHRLTGEPLLKRDDHVIRYLDNIGIPGGVVLHDRPGGFVFHVVGNPERHSRIQARRTWLRKAGERKDRRKAVRIVTTHRDVRVRLVGDRMSKAIVAGLSLTTSPP